MNFYVLQEVSQILYEYQKMFQRVSMKFKTFLLIMERMQRNNNYTFKIFRGKSTRHAE